MLMQLRLWLVLLPVLEAVQISVTTPLKIQRGAAVTTTAITAANHLCWKAATSAAAITACGVAGTATDAGTTGCGAATIVALTWTSTTNTHVSFVECTPTKTLVGNAVATVITETGLAVAATMSIAPGAVIPITGLTAAYWVCWTAGVASAAATCAVAGTATDAGTTGCGVAIPAGTTTFSPVWTTVAGTHIQFVQCSAASAKVGVGQSTIVTVTAQISVVPSLPIQRGAAVPTLGTLTAGNYLCWTAATSATAITACGGAAGTATDAGWTGCGAANDASIFWTTTTNTHVSFAQCTGTATTLVGKAVPTVITETGLAVAATMSIDAGAVVAITGLTAANWVCWIAGTSAGAVTCFSTAGTATDAGTTGCGAAIGLGATTFSPVWTTVAGTHISFIQCSPSGTAVGTYQSTVVTATVRLSNTPEDYKLGDSKGCETGWMPVLNKWQCRAAMDRVDRITTGNQNGENYIGNFADITFLSATLPRGCGFIAKGPGNHIDVTYYNRHPTGDYANPGGLVPPPKPYCMRTGSEIHQKEILFLGDSNIDHWPTTKMFPGSYNLGVGKTTCADMLKRLDSMLKAFEPSVVVLVCGEKDLDDGSSVRKTNRKFKRITQIVMRHHASVVYLGTKPEPRKTKQQHAKYQKYDLSIKRLVRLGTQDERMHDHPTAMIDVHNNFIGRGNPWTLYAKDGLQLSSAGYELWTYWTRTALDDSNCLVWGDGTCKKRRRMSPLR